MDQKSIEEKRLVKMSTLASDFCIIDDGLQLQDKDEYYVILL